MAIFRNNCACFVENCFASRTKFCITRRKLTSALKALEGYLEDIGVKFDFDTLTLSPRCGVCTLAQVCPGDAALILVTQIKIAIELVGVQFVR